MNNRGFTLVEVIISMALVGILAISFIPIVTTQYVNIYKSGDKSEATYKALEDVENQISDPNIKVVDEVEDNVEKDNIIKFGDKEIKNDIKEVEGKGISGTKKEGEEGYQETTLKVGVPVNKTVTPEND